MGIGVVRRITRPATAPIRRRRRQAMTATPVEKLSEGQVASRLEELSEWSHINDQIQRTYAFNDFVQAIAFVNKVAHKAEVVQHHPDILIRYNKVTLTVTTHDSGGITQKDFDLATACDSFLSE